MRGQATYAARVAPQKRVAHTRLLRVGVGPVSWDDTVAAWAQDYGETHRSDCQLEHSPAGRPYDENLYGGAAGGASWSAADAVKAWVSEKAGYNYDSNTCSIDACGHYGDRAIHGRTFCLARLVVIQHGCVFSVSTGAETSPRQSAAA
ncbi:hypothetical protein QYE76_026815 [Lolium multiflorum]|uniref:SCP domain-containing protein n=1 Tax=Lolium multiflorum TaxID=4521 RepID=A0AAD8RL53_LOLMU|nr:hypothetical protein QYE76_026815 [Lolium multiflorum]